MSSNYTVGLDEALVGDVDPVPPDIPSMDPFSSEVLESGETVVRGGGETGGGGGGGGAGSGGPPCIPPLTEEDFPFMHNDDTHRGGGCVPSPSHSPSASLSPAPSPSRMTTMATLVQPPKHHKVVSYGGMTMLSDEEEVEESGSSFLAHAAAVHLHHVRGEDIHEEVANDGVRADEEEDCEEEENGDDGHKEEVDTFSEAETFIDTFLAYRKARKYYDEYGRLSELHSSTDKEEEEFELLVKYKGRSYLHLEWVPESTVARMSGERQRLGRFFRERRGLPLEELLEDPLYMPCVGDLEQVQRIGSTYSNNNNHNKNDEDERGESEQILNLWAIIGQEEEEQKRELQTFNPDYICVDRIIASRFVEQEDEENRSNQQLDHQTNMKLDEMNERLMERRREYLVKWKSLGYDECTWEAEDVILSKWHDKVMLFEERQKPPENFYPKERLRLSSSDDAIELPSLKGCKELMDEDCIKWLVYCWCNNTNCLIADEMSGKAIQVIAMLQWLTEQNRRGPFLVITSTQGAMEQWKCEIEACTDLNCVLFHGSASARQVIKEYEWYYPASSSSYLGQQPLLAPKFNVLVTSSEMIMVESAFLSSIQWEYLVLTEEEHQPFLRGCFEKLDLFRSNHRLILRNSPLQNHIDELWALLHFLEPEKYSAEMFTEGFGHLEFTQQTHKLHQALAPFLLRRISKREGEEGDKNMDKTVPNNSSNEAEGEEIVIQVELTQTQKAYYRAVLEKNREFLLQAGPITTPNYSFYLINVLKELRKCCNHPYLFSGGEECILGRALWHSNNTEIKEEKEGGKDKRPAEGAEGKNDGKSGTMEEGNDLFISSMVAAGLDEASIAAATGASMDVVFASMEGVEIETKGEQPQQAELETKIESEVGKTERSERKRRLTLDEITMMDPEFVNNTLIQASSKLIFLDKLLQQMREKRHKVLVCSKMLNMLDILEDYLSYKKIPFERIDDNTVGQIERQNRIDRFANPDEDVFVLLLRTTKSNVFGLNLAATNAVLLFDSSWNPHNDLQTLACCRDSQTENVKVYRLVTRNTFESYMLEAAYRKLNEKRSDQKESNKKPCFSQEDMERFLKYGAYSLFHTDPHQENELEENMLNEDIDSILQRSTNSSSFSFPSSCFSTGSDKKEEVDLNDSSFWNKTLPEFVSAKTLIKQILSANNNSNDQQKRNEFFQGMIEVLSGLKEQMQSEWCDVITRQKSLLQGYLLIQMAKSRFLLGEHHLHHWNEEDRHRFKLVRDMFLLCHTAERSNNSQEDSLCFRRHHSFSSPLHLQWHRRHNSQNDVQMMECLEEVANEKDEQLVQFLAGEGEGRRVLAPWGTIFTREKQQDSALGDLRHNAAPLLETVYIAPNGCKLYLKPEAISYVLRLENDCVTTQQATQGEKQLSLHKGEEQQRGRHKEKKTSKRSKKRKHQRKHQQKRKEKHTQQITSTSSTSASTKQRKGGVRKEKRERKRVNKMQAKLPDGWHVKQQSNGTFLCVSPEGYELPGLVAARKYLNEKKRKLKAEEEEEEEENKYQDDDRNRLMTSMMEHLPHQNSRSHSLERSNNPSSFESVTSPTTNHLNDNTNNIHHRHQKRSSLKRSSDFVLPEGWTVENRIREVCKNGVSCTQRSKVFTSPNGRKFYSIPQVKAFLRGEESVVNVMEEEEQHQLDLAGEHDFVVSDSEEDGDEEDEEDEDGDEEEVISDSDGDDKRPNREGESSSNNSFNTATHNTNAQPSTSTMTRRKKRQRHTNWVPPEGWRIDYKPKNKMLEDGKPQMMKIYVDPHGRKFYSVPQVLTFLSKGSAGGDDATSSSSSSAPSSQRKRGRQRKISFDQHSPSSLSILSEGGEMGGGGASDGYDSDMDIVNKPFDLQSFLKQPKNNKSLRSTSSTLEHEHMHEHSGDGENEEEVLARVLREQKAARELEREKKIAKWRWNRGFQLPPGWKTEVRPKSKQKAEAGQSQAMMKVYVNPDGKKFYSIPQVMSFLLDEKEKNANNSNLDADPWSPSSSSSGSSTSSTVISRFVIGGANHQQDEHFRGGQQPQYEDMEEETVSVLQEGHSPWAAMITPPPPYSYPTTTSPISHQPPMPAGTVAPSAMNPKAFQAVSNLHHLTSSHSSHLSSPPSSSPSSSSTTTPTKFVNERIILQQQPHHHSMMGFDVSHSSGGGAEAGGAVSPTTGRKRRGRKSESFPIPEGWTVETRTSSTKASYKVYISPNGKKFYSKPQVRKYLGLPEPASSGSKSKSGGGTDEEDDDDEHEHDDDDRNHRSRKKRAKADDDEDEDDDDDDDDDDDETGNNTNANNRKSGNNSKKRRRKWKWQRHFELPEGWETTTILRETGKDKTIIKHVKVYTSPTGRRFYSVPQVKKFLEKQAKKALQLAAGSSSSSSIVGGDKDRKGGDHNQHYAKTPSEFYHHHPSMLTHQGGGRGGDIHGWTTASSSSFEQQQTRPTTNFMWTEGGGFNPGPTTLSSSSSSPLSASSSIIGSRGGGPLLAPSSSLGGGFSSSSLLFSSAAAAAAAVVAAGGDLSKILGSGRWNPSSSISTSSSSLSSSSISSSASSASSWGDTTTSAALEDNFRHSATSSWVDSATSSSSPSTAPTTTTTTDFRQAYPPLHPYITSSSAFPPLPSSTTTALHQHALHYSPQQQSSSSSSSLSSKSAQTNNNTPITTTSTTTSGSSNTFTFHHVHPPQQQSQQQHLQNSGATSSTMSAASLSGGRGFYFAPSPYSSTSSSSASLSPASTIHFSNAVVPSSSSSASSPSLSSTTSTNSNSSSSSSSSSLSSSSLSSLLTSPIQSSSAAAAVAAAIMLGNPDLLHQHQQHHHHVYQPPLSLKSAHHNNAGSTKATAQSKTSTPSQQQQQQLNNERK